MSIEILEIEFKGRRKEYATNPQQFPFLCGDSAIVSTERGHDLGKVSHLGLRPDIQEEIEPVLFVIRKADEQDLQELLHNREREREARKVAKRKITDHNLEMKLVDVETQWDGRKMTFYFTADGRVDFRELVKDLASTFRTRIDLRQIGARDETRKTGGYGVCGRPLCCATFLTEFKPITTQMPRDQFLPLNPSKLSGVCGRLKCCLRYELDIYREFQRNCPKIGHPVSDENKGDGVIDKLDVIREEIHIKYSSGGFDRYSHSDFVEISNWKPQMPKNECICTCGRNGSGIAVPLIPEEEEHDARSVASTGDRVTIGEKGMSLERESGGVAVKVSTDVEARKIPKKSKKRRSRHRKKSGGGDRQTQAGPTPEPANTKSRNDKKVSDAGGKSKAPSAAETGKNKVPKKRRRGGRRARPSTKE